MLFKRMMAKSGAERLEMGLNMFSAARELVWSGIPADLDDETRKKMFFKRFYGEDLPEDFFEKTR